ncbi:MAG: SPOR domain-containing protein [Treponema sp.]|nr:SPOR domain-containing protein [Treponema sp.]
MEKRKLLLVAISVGLFLVLSIGAAILFFAPRNVAVSPGVLSTGTGAIAPPISQISPPVYPLEASRAGTPSALDPSELVREVPGLEAAPEGTARDGASLHIRGTGQGETVINIATPSTAAVPDTAPVGRAAAPAARTTAAAPRPAAAAAPPAQTPRAAAQPSRPAAQARTQSDYWVQTGAFSTIATAERVKENLADQGITSIIDNREVNGQTMFRVRVGPYGSQSEANYWLALIQTINGFENSQVRQTTRL